MSISDRLDEIQARADNATEGPWERGDYFHVQAASHCGCWPEHGPLVSEKRMDINGVMRRAHVHRRSEPFWKYGIYSPTECGGALVVIETGEYGYINDDDAEFIVSARSDVPALVAALRAVLYRHKPCPDEGMGWREDHTYGYVGAVCGACGTPDEYGVPWPCPTVRAVEEALR